MSLMEYKAGYTRTFMAELTALAVYNKKLKSVASKSINTIKQDPYKGARFVRTLEVWRKHVSDDYRILYAIDKFKREVVFYSFRFKNNKTYFSPVDRSQVITWTGII